MERDDDVVVLTLNDPERRNAMTEAMGRALGAEVASLVADASVRCVVLTGAGRAFSAGGDLGMIEGRAAAGRADPGGPAREENRRAMEAFYRLFLAIRDVPCPTVAAINGAAIGAGLCVGLACDLRLAATTARLGLNFTRLGIHPGMGATWTLPRIVGSARAAKLIYTGRVIDGSEAARIGLVDEATEPGQTLERTLDLAREIAASAPLAVRAAKQALARSTSASLDDQLGFEAARQAESYETDDLAEGMVAAREKRTPRFLGR
ncbi:MAG: enoyl-CoA hydratase/isomerase family protein [Deltaproteobacteria bacterium]|nr:enoyl-CoA hydratase/isomerase family protein [Deltaproteobacteria bacterium]